MNLKGLFILFLSVYVVQPLYAQDYIITREGVRKSGSANVENLERNGKLVFIEQDGVSRTYEASDISQFVINDSTVYVSLEIEYAVENNEYQMESFFTKRIVDGALSLDEVYAAPFSYALTKFQESKALQTIDIEGYSRIYKLYQGIFFIYTNDCEVDIKTAEIKNNLSSFIYATNLYNQCVDPDFEYQAKDKIRVKREEIELTYGDTRVTVNGKNSFGTSDEYSGDTQPSIRFRYKRNVLIDEIYFGFGLTQITHRLEQQNRPFTAFTFTEIQIPFTMEYRSYFDIGSISVYGGFSYHTKVTGIDSRGYISLNVGASATAKLVDVFEIGITAEFLERIRNQDFEISPVQTFSFENNTYLGLLFRYHLSGFQ